MKKIKKICFLIAGFTVLKEEKRKAINGPIKVGFVYIGSPGDHGWTYAHDRGAKYVKQEMGSDVIISTIENIPESDYAATSYIENLAQKNDIIFTTSFNYKNPTLKVAKKYPNVKFEHATGDKVADNVSVYSARFYEGRHVIGKIAGRMTKSNIIGYIASFSIPEVIRGINSAYLAAKSVNPDVIMKIVWVYTWFDPSKEENAAHALIAQGADILMQHTDSTAPMKVAEERGIYAFGQVSNMYKWGLNSHLTSIIDNWGPYYLKRVQAVADGNWKSTNTFDGVAEGMVTFTPFTNMPSDVIHEAEETINNLRDGTIHPFTGPINKQDGSIWLLKGETPYMDDLHGMDFYVEGINDRYPG
jgi:basic membrane protein A and related proteins